MLFCQFLARCTFFAGFLRGDKQAVLCEGDSDELVIQKYYKQAKGKLPIEDGIEVISVGTSFLRFLEIAKKLNCRVAVVTDSDGEPEARERKYSDYLGENRTENIKICIDWTVHGGKRVSRCWNLTG